MSEFASEMTDRVTAARTSLADAAAQGDDYLVDVRVGELESLARVAAEHDVEVPGLAETLAAQAPPDDVPLPGRPDTA
ncbi:MAG TPA: hypothetical protein VFD41_02050 [Actinomycetales bacterium]|nr:hypothetical protein [Actinomycetales bacterium]